MSVTQLGYVGLEVTDLSQWERFARDVLGLEVAARGDDTVAVRMDEYAQRLVLHRGGADDLAYAGWEVPDGAALASLVDRLHRAGVRVREGSREEAAARAVDRLHVTEDPAGTRVELYCGPRIADAPFRSTQVVSGFVTGTQGLGHIVLAVPSLRAAMDFYCGLLGLRVSDHLRTLLGGQIPLEIVFLHANPRHHSLAMGELPLPKRLNHFMLEVASLDDVGRAFDRCLEGGVPIVRSLGRHPNDRMFSFYAATPSGFEVEYGWGARTVDYATWRVCTYGQISEWGHRPPA